MTDRMANAQFWLTTWLSSIWTAMESVDKTETKMWYRESYLELIRLAEKSKQRVAK